MQDKSEENWAVGQQCLMDSRLNAAANRLYYAVFQAVFEFATKKRNYVSPGHSAHSSMLNIVRNYGKGRTKYGEVFNDLMGLRETADYDRETPDKNDIENLLQDANAIRMYYLQQARN